MAQLEAPTLPQTPDVAKLGQSLAGLSQMGDNPLGQARRLDAAWAESNNSVIATAAALNQPYAKTMKQLTNPAIGAISVDDPRHVAYQIAVFETTSEDKAPKVERQDTAMLAAQERLAMGRLTRNPEDERGFSSLIEISKHQVSNELERTQRRVATKDNQR